MKKVMSLLMLATLLVFVGCEKESILPFGNDPFTVSEDGRQVCFALGNLEYDSIDGYRFTAHQYDYGGYFGWGTGSNPMLTSEDGWHDYPSFDDWGNHIDGGWHTLTKEEWHYVIYDRPQADGYRRWAKVCGVYGLVLLPDNFYGSGIHIFIHTTIGREPTSVYDEASWSALQDSGAIFLPAAGFRSGTELKDVDTFGRYWSSTPGDDGENLAYTMIFFNNYASVGDYVRYLGQSVRLVREYKRWLW